LLRKGRQFLFHMWHSCRVTLVTDPVISHQWGKDRIVITSNVQADKFILICHTLLLTRRYWTKGSYWLSWSHHFESFTIATMTWSTITAYLCLKWPRICSDTTGKISVILNILHQNNLQKSTIIQYFVKVPKNLGNKVSYSISIIIYVILLRTNGKFIFKKPRKASKRPQ
jgi:hypothetical protein